MSTAAIKDRLGRLWTYRWSVTLDGQRYDIRLECRWRCNSFAVTSGGECLAREVLDFYAEPFRLQELAVKTASGGLLTFRTAPRNLLSYGLEVARDGAVVHQSHPHPLAGLAAVQKISTFGSSAEGRRQAEQGKEIYPAIAADIAVGLLLYLAVGYMSLREVAVLGAAAVLLLMLVDWTAERLFLRKLHLTGGFSGLGVIMLLASAAFAWLVDSELAIMLKSSLLGLLGALLLASDAMLGGKYIGRRMSQYITFIDVDPRRFAWGSAMAAATQSLLSGVIAIWLSRDAWLFYKHWIGPLLAFTLGAVVLWKSRRKSVPQ
jgi:intracellular septation protein A